VGTLSHEVSESLSNGVIFGSDSHAKLVSRGEVIEADLGGTIHCSAGCKAGHFDADGWYVSWLFLYL